MAKANKAPSKQAMRGKGGRADVIDTPEGRARREAAIANVVGRRARVVSIPIIRHGANDNNSLAVLERKVELRLRWAADVIRRAPMGKGAYPSDGGCAWPDVVRDFWESAQYTVIELPRVVPPEKDIEKAVALLACIAGLPERERKVLAARLLASGKNRKRLSYRQLGDMFGVSHATIRSDYRVALVTLGLTISDDTLQI